MKLKNIGLKKYRTKKYRTKKYRGGLGWFSSNPSSNSNDEIQNLKQKYKGKFGFEEWYNNYIKRKDNDPNIKKISRNFRQFTNTEKSYEDKYLRSYEYVEYKNLKKEEEKRLEEENIKEEKIKEEKIKEEEEEIRIGYLLGLFVEISNDEDEYYDDDNNDTQKTKYLMKELKIGSPDLIVDKLINLITNSNLNQLDKNKYIALVDNLIKKHYIKSKNYTERQLLINQMYMPQTHNFTREQMLKMKEDNEKIEKEREDKKNEIFNLLSRYNDLDTEEYKKLIELTS